MSSKEPLKTTTLIGWMWKHSDMWSWPILIAREAWPYNFDGPPLDGIHSKKSLQLQLCQRPKRKSEARKCYNHWFEVGAIKYEKRWWSRNNTSCSTLWIRLKAAKHWSSDHCAAANEQKVMPDDHSKLVPLLPIPNRTVKRLRADDRADSRVKVGHRQAFIAKRPAHCWTFSSLLSLSLRSNP